jgi:hypothetical protein
MVVACLERGTKEYRERLRQDNRFLDRDSDPREKVLILMSLLSMEKMNGCKIIESH